MKKLFTLLTTVIITACAMAQAPEKMNYQAVIRDAANALVISQPVGMQLSILQGSVTGTAVYVETQALSSNINGLVSLEIGTGNLISGSFNTIDWSNGPYFIKTETDPTGGTTYTITGISQLMSVPYSFYANVADSVVNDHIDDADADSTNELQNLSLNGTSIDITNGNSIDISSSFLWNANANDIYFNNGNVGIGTNSPDEKLTLEGLTSGSIGRTFLSLKNNSTDGHSSVNLKLFAGNNSSFTGIYHHSDTYTASSNFNGVGALWNHGNGLSLRSSGLGIIRFETNTSMSTIERMRINSVGNVGIGTSNPNSKLQIKNGDVYIETINAGIIMASPNGQCWRMTVDDSGNPVFTSITCP